MVKSAFLFFIGTYFLTATPEIHLPSLSLPWKVNKGTVIYNLQLTGKADSLQQSMMAGSQMSISFYKKMVRMETNFQILKTIFTIDESTGKAVLLCKIPGEKYAVDMTPENVSEFMGASDTSYSIFYSDDKKEIAGFKCRHALVKHTDGSILNVFYTRKLTPRAKNYRQHYKELKGFPLEYELLLDGTGYLFTAESVYREVDPALFDLTIPPDFQKISFAQIKAILNW